METGEKLHQVREIKSKGPRGMGPKKVICCKARGFGALFSATSPLLFWGVIIIFLESCLYFYSTSKLKRQGCFFIFPGSCWDFQLACTTVFLSNFNKIVLELLLESTLNSLLITFRIQRGNLSLMLWKSQSFCSSYSLRK